MAELVEFKQKKVNSRMEYEPVGMSDGTKITFHKEVTNGKRNFYAEAKKDDREVGRVSWYDDNGSFRLYVDKIDSIGEEAAKEIATTLFNGILQLLNE